MKLSYDNQYLYTAGMDGSLCVFQIQDKDKLKRDLTNYSQEILIRKKVRDELKQQITNLDESIKTEKRNRAEEAEAQRQKFEKIQEDLRRDMDEKK